MIVVTAHDNNQDLEPSGRLPNAAQHEKKNQKKTQQEITRWAEIKPPDYKAQFPSSFVSPDHQHRALGAVGYLPAPML